ncbi:hypothetical protein BDZ97DRAFT_1889245 [Flammula alnicola]|nr:hypothetical protein BDZ97DRAFT_1889245 [Flammula alnicola]
MAFDVVRRISRLPEPRVLFVLLLTLKVFRALPKTFHDLDTLKASGIFAICLDLQLGFRIAVSDVRFTARHGKVQGMIVVVTRHDVRIFKRV